MTKKQYLAQEFEPKELIIRDYRIETTQVKRKFYVFVRDSKINRGVEMDIEAPSHYEAWLIFKQMIDATLYI